VKKSSPAIMLRLQLLSTTGAVNNGSTVEGTIMMAANKPESQVELVLSKTTRLKAKLMAAPPAALTTVPRVMMVKSFFHRVGFI
jgi:predicted lysophospholipase L1 biosynthesis ABC-type transport system permease subunit